MYAQQMGRIQRTRAWLYVIPPTVNGTELGEQEWKDYFFLRYRIDPPDLPDHCYGCGEEFSIRHTLNCKKGDLITAHNNDIRNGVADLAGKTFTPTHMCGDPKIFTGRAVCGGEANDKGKGELTKDEGDLNGDLLILDL